MELNRNNKENEQIVLSSNEETFARYIAEGYKKTDAYTKAYKNYKNSKKRNSIHTLASAVSKKSQVQAKIQFFREQFRNNLDLESQITVARQLKYTQKVVQETMKSKDWNNCLKALDMQSKLTGVYAPVKSVNKNLNVEVPDGYVEV